MTYVIKTKTDDGVETWIASFAEYVAAGAAKPVQYPTREAAEDAARILDLTEYEIVEYVGKD